jgi:hypothetical protein
MAEQYDQVHIMTNYPTKYESYQINYISNNEMARNISESEIKNDNFTVKLAFLFNSENSVILRYTRNIVQLNSFYVKFDSKHYFIYIINTIINWRVSLSKICHSLPNNIVTHSCAARIRELLFYLSCTCSIFSMQTSTSENPTCNFRESVLQNA